MVKPHLGPLIAAQLPYLGAAKIMTIIIYSFIHGYLWRVYLGPLIDAGEYQGEQNRHGLAFLELYNLVS